MLRAVRFAATFNFDIELETLRAIQAMSGEVLTVSAERIGMEIRRMLVDANRAVAMELLRTSTLLPHVLPELAESTNDSWKLTLQRLGRLRQPTLPLALAAALLSADGASVESIGRRLRYTNKEIDRSAWLLKNLATVVDAPATPWPKLQRLLTHEGAEELVALLEAVVGPGDAAVALCRGRLAWPPEQLNPPLLVDGSDLIGHGLTPGPEFAALLEQIRDAQLNGEIRTRDDALALADRLRAQHNTLR